MIVPSPMLAPSSTEAWAPMETWPPICTPGAITAAGWIAGAGCGPRSNTAARANARRGWAMRRTGLSEIGDLICGPTRTAPAWEASAAAKDASSSANTRFSGPAAAMLDTPVITWPPGTPRSPRRAVQPITVSGWAWLKCRWALRPAGESSSGDAPKATGLDTGERSPRSPW